MKTTILLLLALSFTCLLNSCVGECWCEKDLGCAVLTVKKKNSNSADTVITRKILCSQSSYYSDWVLLDSIRAFQNRYTTDSSYVEVKDSIYKHYDPVSVKRNVNQYSDSGYNCTCPK